MAKFAPVCPTPILQGFAVAGTFPDYHLVLAHDIVKHSDAYEAMFKNRSRMVTVILDNSVIELGNAVDIGMIVEAASIVRPDTTVLPDVLLDSEATVKNCKEALDVWAQRFDDAALDEDFMYVPQGRTLTEFADCAEALAEDPRINFWGVPRNAVATEIGTRKDLPTLLYGLNVSRMIHLLGFSDNFADDIISAQNPFVLGIDSAVPIRAVTQGVAQSFRSFNNMPKRGDWFETAQFQPEMIDALRRTQRIFHG